MFMLNFFGGGGGKVGNSVDTVIFRILVKANFLLQSSKAHVTRAVLELCLAFSKYLSNLHNGAPLLKQLCDHILLNPAIWIHIPAQVQLFILMNTVPYDVFIWECWDQDSLAQLQFLASSRNHKKKKLFQALFFCIWQSSVAGSQSN